MNIKGKVHFVGVTQQVSETFKKRDLVIEYAENPSYPEYIKLELLQDKVSLADGLAVGQEVEAEFNLRGRPYENKQGVTTYFNSLVIWKINAGGAVAGYTAPVSAPMVTGDEPSDLPF